MTATSEIHSWWVLLRSTRERNSLDTQNHCVKSVQLRSFFWSVFSCIQSQYRKIRTRKNSGFGDFSRSAIYVMCPGVMGWHSSSFAQILNTKFELVRRQQNYADQPHWTDLLWSIEEDKKRLTSPLPSENLQGKQWNRQ